MQDKNHKQINFSLLYILLAAADFFYIIYNIVLHSTFDDYKFSQIAISFLEQIPNLLPIAAFIILSKKVEQIEDIQKCMKIKNYVLIYIFASIFIGLIYFILTDLYSIRIPNLPFKIFYSYNWLYYISYLIKYNIYRFIIPLIFDINFWIISIMFANSITKKFDKEKTINYGTGKTSAGYKLAIASIVILCIQTLANIIIAIAMHENLYYTSGWHAIGAALLAFFLIIIKLIIDFILLPVIPLSIIGIVRCNSKLEIEQDRKNRIVGRRINIICLVIAVLQLIFLW